MVKWHCSTLLHCCLRWLTHWKTLAEREDNPALKTYSDQLKEALITTVEQGYITADLQGKTNNPEQETVVDMYGFLDNIEKNMLQLG